MRKTPRPVPKVLLVGTGRFGSHHLRLLKELEAEGKIRFVGAVIRDPKKRVAVESEAGIDTYPALTTALLKSVDAVDIVTPPETHYALARQCLAHADVFIEKPLAMNECDALALVALARENGHRLMVGHIFRFHPVAKRLKSLLSKRTLPSKIEGVFVNPLDTDQGREPALEMIHLFDVIDMIWSKTPKSVYARDIGRISVVDSRYGTRCDARLTLGWKGDSRERSLSFFYENETIEANFMSGTITRTKGNAVKQDTLLPKDELLRDELRSFIRSLSGKAPFPVNGTVAARVVSVAERVVRSSKSSPSVAVIGGGFFGANIGAETAADARVTLFEKGPSLMSEGSYVNQMRHHVGYHYPRSDETAQEVQESKGAFEHLYEEAICRENPTYYAIAKTGSLVTTDEFRAFCKRHGLPHTPSTLPETLLAKEEIDMCFEVVEPSYDLAKLKNLVEGRLTGTPVRIRKGTTVRSIKLLENGKKRLTYADSRGIHVADFDIVINATYAGINQFARGLGFRPVPVRIDVAEVVIVTLPIDPISITVVDGPFATLMPTSVPNQFALYHARESVIERYVPETGLARKVKRNITNAGALLAACRILFPIVKDAVFVESRVINRGVMANHEHDDRRTADITDHGFGVYSVLSGKISSSVSTALKIKKMILTSVETSKKHESK